MYAINKNGGWKRVEAPALVGNVYNPQESHLLEHGYYPVVDTPLPEGHVATGYAFDRLEDNIAYFNVLSQTPENIEAARLSELAEPWVRNIMVNFLTLLGGYGITLPVETILGAMEEVIAKAQAANAPFDVDALFGMYVNLRLGGLSDEDIPLIADFISGGN